MGLFVLAAIFFLTAWSFSYWQAWMYLATLFIPMLFVLAYMLNNAPDLLERRMRMREHESEQKQLIKISYIIFILTFLLPGFDVRYGWSQMPAFVAIAADLIVFLGYGIFYIVVRENQYASRVIEVDTTQHVISSGPYAVVRHPMYTGLLLLYIFSPIALGSYWAVIPVICMVPIMVGRIFNEEKVLTRDLKGYSEYLIKVRYRLIPGIW